MILDSVVVLSERNICIYVTVTKVDDNIFSNYKTIMTVINSFTTVKYIVI